MNNDTSIHSGFPLFDALTNGLHKSELITIAGGSGMGKTTFMLSLANNISKLANKNVLIVTMEWTSHILVKLLTRDEMLAQKFRDLYMPSIDEVVDNPLFNNIFIDDTGCPTPTQLRQRIIDIINHVQIDVVLIDYIQLIDGREFNQTDREREDICDCIFLKHLAAEISLPIVVLYHIGGLHNSVAEYTRSPRLSDIPIEIVGYSNVLGIIYRPLLCDDLRSEDFSNDPIFLHLWRNAHGYVGSVTFAFDKQTSLYVEHNNDINNNQR